MRIARIDLDIPQFQAGAPVKQPKESACQVHVLVVIIGERRNERNGWLQLAQKFGEFLAQARSQFVPEPEWNFEPVAPHAEYPGRFERFCSVIFARRTGADKVDRSPSFSQE